ncbi:DUF1461 domain-containing protein [Thalassomonas sp. M1454]|uniref:lipoprotein intramolecular transacylase Lit n=1 Tax=Thalassomonas sp. M1454 TaxID=2594477 RepID=UPI00117FDAB1|nr:DUF1461 domain-containing protein [Thalassomonas sp. M1454]TRX54450.1 DUF1461 domain-containing protein [Thalassomonas sp. M1454]
MLSSVKNQKTLPALIWLCFCTSLFIFSSGISWKLNSAIDFTYPNWYQALDIKNHIQTYAPQNQYNKQDFVHTSSEQHYSLFSEVVVAINNHGEGLDKISYTIDERTKRLFTKSEVIHLEDVSILIDRLTWLWLVNLIPLSILLFAYIKNKVAMPDKKLKLQALITSALVIVLSFAFLGFKQIFYYFHTLVFPDNHQWFFYYQESLMSTFMKAPDLFAVMGLNLFLIAIIIFYLVNYFLNKYINNITPNQ